VTYRPRAGNKAALGVRRLTALTRETVVLSGDDGSFGVPVLPRSGPSPPQGPTPDFVQIETTSGDLDAGKPASRRLYPDGLAALDLKAGGGPHRLSR